MQILDLNFLPSLEKWDRLLESSEGNSMEISSQDLNIPIYFKIYMGSGYPAEEFKTWKRYLKGLSHEN